MARKDDHRNEEAQQARIRLKEAAMTQMQKATMRTRMMRQTRPEWEEGEYLSTKADR